MRQRKPIHLGRWAAIAIAATIGSAFALMPASAGAAPPPVLTQFAECTAAELSTNEPCGQAGKAGSVGALATNPATGNVYVVDGSNNRIAEYSIWGTFIRAWGWGVRNGAAELQTCTSETGCQKGLKGSGVGEFDYASGLAVDSSGDVFVADEENHRVEKFDSEGRFLLMFGGGVDQGPHSPGDVCTAASIAGGDTCGAGSTGVANGQFGGAGDQREWPFGSYLSVGPGDKVYVGDHERIQVFDGAGAFIESLPLPGKTVLALAVAPSGHIYVSVGDSRAIPHPLPNVLELSASGVELATLPVAEPWDLATDVAGNLYVVDKEEITDSLLMVREFTPSGAEVPSFAFTDGLVHSYGIATSSACGIAGAQIYISNNQSPYHPIGNFVRAYGPPPNGALCPPPKAAPDIASQWVASAGSDRATLKALIDPEFWSDTSYYVQYGTGKCSEGGCESVQPAAPGARLTSGTTNQNVATAAVSLSDLAPGTVYHYRFVATSSGGGPVRGVGGEVGKDGSEGTFTTFPVLAGVTSGCPNQAFRLRAAAALPDCRAYELVSPLEKNGGDIEAPESVTVSGEGGYFLARIDQANPEGTGITYSTIRAFAGAESAPWSSQYISRRSSMTGWATEVINPPLNNISIYGSRSQEIPFFAFSEDLCNSYLQQQTSLTLTPGAPEGVPNVYRRHDCSDGSYELLTTAPPAHISHYSAGGEEYLPVVQGATPDGSHSFVRVNGALTPEAASGYAQQLYETSENGELRLVSVLPNGTAATTAASVGTAVAAKGDFHNDSVAGAVSEDGSRVFWTASSGSWVPGGGYNLQPGTVYLRANPLAEQSATGRCVEAGKACTLAISAPNSEFWAANTTGSRVIYQTGEHLFEASIEEAGGVLGTKSTEIADGVAGVVGQSTDTTRVYLVSSHVLSPGESSSQGDEAAAGKPNLYLYDMAAERRFTFVATLGGRESAGLSFGQAVDSIYSSSRQSRVSASGDEAGFTSWASLTGYDNTDVNSGEPDSEVFRYDAATNQLDCVSCNPTGARPAGQQIGGVNTEQYWSAAEIPGWAYTQYPARVLSADGDRLFFESYDALVPSDTNGSRDVYEWERTSSQAACDELGATMYVASAGGCLSLISSGESPQPSEFIDASADGNDVFFTTSQGLVPEDKGLVDLYDARVDGGFARKTLPSVCEGEACQGVSSPPKDVTPASMSFSGPGNRVSPLTAITPVKKASAKPKTTAQLRRALGKALKACRRKPKAKRKRCEAVARKRYHALSTAAAKKASDGGDRS